MIIPVPKSLWTKYETIINELEHLTGKSLTMEAILERAISHYARSAKPPATGARYELTTETSMPLDVDAAVFHVARGVSGLEGFSNVHLAIMALEYYLLRFRSQTMRDVLDASWDVGRVIDTLSLTRLLLHGHYEKEKDGQHYVIIRCPSCGRGGFSIHFTSTVCNCLGEDCRFHSQKSNGKPHDIWDLLTTATDKRYHDILSEVYACCITSRLVPADDTEDATKSQTSASLSVHDDYTQRLQGLWQDTTYDPNPIKDAAFRELAEDYASMFGGGRPEIIDDFVGRLGAWFSRITKERDILEIWTNCLTASVSAKLQKREAEQEINDVPF